ncbi:MAG: NifB/NifX family molybdenum-iron cluster-binding protein [Elusimicrobiota bacterium]
MKICVSSQGKDLDSAVDPRFGRCACFIIVDTETLAFEAVANDNAQGMGGVGVQSATLVSQRGVKAVLTGNCGPNAFNALKAAGVAIYTGVSGKVRDAVEAHRKGTLQPASQPRALPGGKPGMGGM